MGNDNEVSDFHSLSLQMNELLPSARPYCSHFGYIVEQIGEAPCSYGTHIPAKLC